jgi:transcriptional regulator with GAF, ATPase, and Fis domain
MQFSATNEELSGGIVVVKPEALDFWDTSQSHTHYSSVVANHVDTDIPRRALLHVDLVLGARSQTASHRDLPEMIRQGNFREDLFYRLSVFPIEIPPLRERPEDIPLLVNYFVSKLSKRMRKDIKSVPKQAMEVLTNSRWKGNVRELANFIERAVILSQGEELKMHIAELQLSHSHTALPPPLPSMKPSGKSSSRH